MSHTPPVRSSPKTHQTKTMGLFNFGEEIPPEPTHMQSTDLQPELGGAGVRRMAGYEGALLTHVGEATTLYHSFRAAARDYAANPCVGWRPLEAGGEFGECVGRGAAGPRRRR